MTKQHLERSGCNGTADLLKGFAVIFMIQVHLMEQFAAPDASESLIGKISMFLGGPPCAPVFMAVMGYFLAFSGKPLSYFLKRGAILFLGGILLNLARSANLLTRIVNHSVNLDPWTYFLGVDIFTLAGLSLIFIGILRRLFKSNIYPYLITAVLAVFIARLLPQGNSGSQTSVFTIAFLWGTSPWAYFPLFPWFGYVLAGYAFNLIIRKYAAFVRRGFRQYYVSFIPFWAGLIVTWPWAAGISNNLAGYGGYYHHGVLFFAWVILFIISYLIFMKLFDGKYGHTLIAGWIKWMGRQVTLLYIIQWIIIGNLAPEFYGTQNIFQLIGWFFVVMAATNVTGYLITKIRVRKILYNLF